MAESILANGGRPVTSYLGDTSVETFKVLLAGGAQVDAQEKVHGCTPLHDAAWTGRVENVKVLLAAGADVNHKDMDGQTALDATQEELAKAKTERERADLAAVITLLKKAGGKTGAELK